MTNDLILARKYDFGLGAKVVRGAYLEIETRKWKEQAKKKEEEFPIWNSYEETNQNYDR